MHIKLVASLCFSIGMFAGVQFQKFAASQLSSATLSQWSSDGLLIDAYSVRRNRDLTGREQTRCPSGGVTLILGQSNAANYAGGRFRSDRGAVDWLDGKCYRSAGATLGSDGIGGSIWPLVADLLPGEPQKFVGLSFGSTSSAEWADPLRLGGLLQAQLDTLKAAQLGVDRVVWHQGESDFDTTPATYVSNVRKVIERVHTAFPQARFFVAQASACAFQASRAELLAAQASLADGAIVFAGPNTDLIAEFSDRYDGCHFSGEAARRVAQAWAARIVSAP